MKIHGHFMSGRESGGSMLLARLEGEAGRHLHLPRSSEVHQFAYGAVQTAERRTREDLSEGLPRLNARSSGT